MKKHTGSVKETMEEMKNVLDLRQISHFLLDLEKVLIFLKNNNFEKIKSLKRKIKIFAIYGN